MNIFDKRPLFLIITIMISGFVGFTFGDSTVRGMLIAFSILSLVLSLIFYFKKKICNKLFIVIPIALLFSMLCSYTYFDQNFKLYENYSGTVEIEGKIVSITKNDFSANIIVQTSKIDGETKRGYKIKMDIPKYNIGDEFTVGGIISFKAKLCEFEDFTDMDATAYYFARGISSDTENIEELEYISDGSIPIAAYSERARFAIAERAETLSNDKAGSLFSALFLGSRDLLDDQITLDFKRLGITHILALSGQHLTIIYVAVSKILSSMQVKKKVRLVVVSVLIVLYVILTGMCVSVVRAAIMIIITSALFLLGKTKDSVTSLALSVLLILIFTPYAVYDLALWLSALSTLGIVAMENTDEYTPKATLWQSILNGVVSSFKASLFATSATLLVTVCAFGALSFVSAVATFIFNILSELILYIGIVMLIFGEIIPIGFALNLVSQATYWLANVMAKPDWVFLYADYLLVVIVTVSYTVGFLLFLSLKFKNIKRASVILAICFVLVSVLSLATNLIDSNNDISICNMDNSGDRILLRSNRETALINASNYSKSEAYNSYSLLTKYRITYLDIYYLADYSSGTIGDVLKITSLIRVDEVYLPRPRSQSEEFIAEDLSEDLQGRSTKIRFYDINETSFWNEYQITALHRSSYNSSYKKNAISIYNGETNLLYLSPGMMSGKEKILAYQMIAESNAILFGARGMNKYKVTYFDVYNENIKHIYIGNDNLQITYTISNLYEKSGIEVNRNATVNLFN